MAIVRRSVPIPAPHVYPHRLQEVWNNAVYSFSEENKRRFHIEALRVLRDLVKEMAIPASSWEVRSKYGTKDDIGDAIMTCEFVRVQIIGSAREDSNQVMFETVTSKKAIFGNNPHYIQFKQFTRLKEFAELLNRYNRRNV